MLMALCHSDETGWVEITNLDTVSDLRADEASLVWGEADMNRLDPGDIATITEEFELDSMAVEDAVRPRQRPKLEVYERHRFAVLHQLHEVDGHLEKKQVSCFVGDDFVLVIHESAAELLAEARKRLRSSSHHTGGPSYRLYVLVDTVVDEYQSHADNLEEAIERIEDEVVGAAQRRVGRSTDTKLRQREDERIQLQLYSIKQQIARLRRYALPLERVLEGLMEPGDSGTSPEGARKLLRDVHDHTLRISDQVHNVDALAQALLDLLHAEQSEDLSEINKRLTGWAAIFAVPTVIASTYGMNYRLWPADGTALGFWIALGAMVAAAVALFVYFSNKEWL